MNPDTLATLRLIIQGTIPNSYREPASWAAEHITFTHDKDPIKGRLDLSISPYLVDPINAWELIPEQGLKEVTVAAPEQGGKTLSWMCGLAWTLEHRQSLSLIYYTSDEKANKINEEKLDPILRGIPRCRELLELPNARTADRYRLGDNLVYFSGVGSRIASHSARHCIADELDDWRDEKGSNALIDLRKRTRTFPEALLFKVCTVKGSDTQSRIWREFKNSSQGYWHLGCLRCNAHSMRSCDVVNLQWELDAEERLIPESLRLICPKCGREHLQQEKLTMNRNGRYLHRHPELLASRPGFQWGALAVPFRESDFDRIAEAQLKAGKSGRLDDQIYFDNSIRGLPFKVRKLDDTGRAALKRHTAPRPSDPELLFRFLSADTQDDCFYWVVRGIDKRSNSYLLNCGRAATVEELAEVWEMRHAGGKVICGIIDEGGHRLGEVRDFTATRPGMFTYKGNPRIGRNFTESETQKRLLLANPHHYHDHLLFHLYASTNKGNNYWFVHPELPPDYETQLTSWKPNPLVRNGNDLDKYHCPDGNDHYFDAEKMLLVLLDYFKQKILPQLVRAKTRPTVKRA